MTRHRIALLAATAAVLVAPAAAGAQDTVPAPKVVTTTLGKTPLVELEGGGGGLPYLGSTTPYDAGDWQPALVKYHDSGVYDHQLGQIGARAQSWLRKHDEKVDGSKPALVLDIDETTLSNYLAIVADNFAFGPNSKAEATNQVGVAIKPTLKLVQIAKAHKITVFFITGRGEAVRAPTAANLTREGFTTYKSLTLKPATFTGTTIAYKAGARKAIEQQGYRIVENVGDQYSDLAGGHALRDFKYPNPFYYLP